MDGHEIVLVLAQALGDIEQLFLNQVAVADINVNKLLVQLYKSAYSCSKFIVVVV